ncbi:MAG: ABC transporter ATP-binding protein [Cellulosilyticaceae bacterium]
MIEVKNLTLKYPSGKGVFDLDFTVRQGEVMGYLGPNGAGKTTTIRALMGFMKPDGGQCHIGGLDCFDRAPQIQQQLGYIPGEITFVEGMTGEEYLKFIAEMRGMKDLTRQKELLERFELSPKGNIKKFSKGMKQKLGIVAAFMHQPEVIILDEPTSGLDPLMQNRFIELILEEKAKGRTILMSSHIFEEVERTCDNVLIIKEGRIVAQSGIESLKSTRRRGYTIKTEDPAHTMAVLQAAGFEVGEQMGSAMTVYVTGETIDQFGKLLGQFTLLGLETKSQTLEDIFMHYYAKGEN